MECGSLSSQLAARARKLRPCTTIVTTADGRCFVEPRTESLTDSIVPLTESSQCPASLDPSMTTEVDGSRNLDTFMSQSHVRRSGQNEIVYQRKCPGFVIDNTPDLRCSEIFPYLLLGSQDVANDEGILKKYRVTHILSLLPAGVFEEDYLMLLADGSVVQTGQAVSGKDNGIDEVFKSSESQVTSITISKDTSDVLIPTSDTSITTSTTSVTTTSITPTTASTTPISQASQLITRVYAPMLDCPEFPLLEYMDSCHRYICSVQNAGGVVLVHCNAGVSRAPSVVIAHLMALYGHSYEQALQLVLQKRTYIRPNAGFVQQLKIYEHRLTKL